MRQPPSRSGSIVGSLTSSDLTRSSWIYIMLLLSLFSMITFPADAQISPQGTIEIEQGGKLWIEGSAGFVNYVCRAEQLSGNGTIENKSEPKQNIKGHGAVSILVRIPVYSLECGKKAMNNDMFKALKASEYPSIRYKLLHATLVVDSVASLIDKEDDWMNIKTTGVLEIAGVQDTSQMYVKGKLINNERFRVQGSKSINMETFQIKPPAALFGLIKANNRLRVYFDVTLKLKNL